MSAKIRDELKKIINEVIGINIDLIDNDKDLSKIDEWDSFNNLILIARVEDHFKITLSVKDIEEVNTIRKVVELTERKVKQKL